jgi:hypothetical protein
LQKSNPVGTLLSILYKNISFLLKFGVLALVLSINYTLNKPHKQPDSQVIFSANFDYSKKDQKANLMLPTENQPITIFIHN